MQAPLPAQRGHHHVRVLPAHEQLLVDVHGGGLQPPLLGRAQDGVVEGVVAAARVGGVAVGTLALRRALRQRKVAPASEGKGKGRGVEGGNNGNKAAKAAGKLIYCQKDYTGNKEAILISVQSFNSSHSILEPYTGNCGTTKTSKSV